MVSALNLQTFTGEFESDLVPHSYDLLLHLNKTSVNYKMYVHKTLMKQPQSAGDVEYTEDISAKG